MKNPILYATLMAALLANAASAGPTGADPHGGRPPSAGDATTPQGGTGSKSMEEGTQAGAPGNVVTAAQGSVMTGHDVDADGYVTKAEAANNGDLAKQFAKLDKNGDGKLDEKEFNGFTPSKSAVAGAAPATARDVPADKSK